MSDFSAYINPTSVNAFATVVGLVGLYRQEKGAKDSLTGSKFLEWLTEHQHENTRVQIENNSQLLSSLDGLLKLERGIFLDKFDQVMSQLAQIMSRIDTFSSVTQSMLPNIKFSDEAVSFLKILVESGGKEILMMYDMGGPPILEVVEVCGIPYEDDRFLEDDFDSLCRLVF